jgi:diadenosine tetraphosphate (Ap4A) HIT family hydrolase
MDDCLVCREQRGEVELPGGALVDDALVFAFHVPPLEVSPRPYLGHLLVTSKRHVDHFGDLTPSEAARVGVVAAELAGVLRRMEAVERVFSAVIGTGVPHFHLHLLARYAGTPAGVRWFESDEWEGAPHGDRDEIAAFVERLRAACAA